MASVAPAPYEQLVSSETLTHVRELAPWLSKRSAAIEREHELPLDVLAAVTEAGCLRMAVPAEYGGADLTLPQAIAVVEELTRADGSLGWLIGQVTLAHVVFGYLPLRT
ncbi:MAG TPA: acyl-CoA dehydrogenase family protein, partial [Solirubrobacteraceae bacterium]|nr:acyl-CoA dehydrogenase family protein [Solirubrobacteraceae bacterium]